jgi:hypothetical protein
MTKKRPRAIAVYCFRFENREKLRDKVEKSAMKNDPRQLQRGEKERESHKCKVKHKIKRRQM